MHTGIKVHVVVPCTHISLALSGADVTVILISRFMNPLKLPIKLTYIEYSYMVSYFSFLVFLFGVSLPDPGRGDFRSSGGGVP